MSDAFREYENTGKIGRDKGVVSTGLLSGVTIQSIKTFRSCRDVRRNNDKARVVLDLDIRGNAKLYHMFRNQRHRQLSKVTCTKELI